MSLWWLFRGDQSDEQGEGPDQRDFTLRQTTTFEKKTIQIQNMNEQQSVNLKDFNIIERLGKGSFGSVYLVEKISNAQIHAMKVLEKEKILK